MNLTPFLQLGRYLVTQGSTLELTLSPGRIALGIAKVVSFGSGLILRIFINSIEPYVIVNYLHITRNVMQFPYELLMLSHNDTRISLVKDQRSLRLYHSIKSSPFPFNGFTITYYQLYTNPISLGCTRVTYKMLSLVVEHLSYIL